MGVFGWVAQTLYDSVTKPLKVDGVREMLAVTFPGRVKVVEDVATSLRLKAGAAITLGL